MKQTIVAAAGALLLLGAQAKTTQDGVYTDAQVKRGEATYGKACASCHQTNLEGDGQAPSLAGKDFDSEWNDQPLADLLERIRATMPGDAPGTLKPAEAADVLAFMLAKGGQPAGQTDLPSDAAAIKTIKYTAARR
jgi:mono/diheme cytochrome c family protein